MTATTFCDKYHNELALRYQSQIKKNRLQISLNRKTVYKKQKTAAGNILFERREIIFNKKGASEIFSHKINLHIKIIQP